MEHFPVITLPPAFQQGPYSARQLGAAAALPETTAPAATPLARPDPTEAWYDLSTVANVVSIVTNLLR